MSPIFECAPKTPEAVTEGYEEERVKRANREGVLRACATTGTAARTAQPIEP